MNEIREFIDGYYTNNMEFDNEMFMRLLDHLLSDLGQFIAENSNCNIIFENMMSKYQNKDYYYLVELMEYELIPTLEKDGTGC